MTVVPETSERTPSLLARQHEDQTRGGAASTLGVTYWPAAVLVKATSWDFLKGFCAIVGEEWQKQQV